MNKLSRCKQRSIRAAPACCQRAISPPYDPDCSPGARSPLHYPAFQPNWPNSAGKILNISDAGILDALEEPVLELTESRLRTLKHALRNDLFPANGRHHTGARSGLRNQQKSRGITSRIVTFLVHQ